MSEPLPYTPEELETLRNGSQYQTRQNARWFATLQVVGGRVAQLELELERERMRLAACGVVAGANTPEPAARHRQMHADYRSAACDDVAAAVDREIALRAQVENLEVQLARALDAIVLAKMKEPPPPILISDPSGILAATAQERDVLRTQVTALQAQIQAMVHDHHVDRSQGA